MLLADCMKINEQPITLSIPDIEVGIDELALKLMASSINHNLMNFARDVLERVSGTWNPAIIYRWCRCQRDEIADNVYSLNCDESHIKIDLGYSGQFLKGAEHALIAAYTAGDGLEKVGQAATKAGQFLDSYLVDMIGLVVLEKTGILVKRTVQDQAVNLGWGASPFLSPGSVHGWHLEEQAALCSLLPLANAGLTLQTDFTLRPFKSLSCLIGIGPDYTSAEVGDTCEVCTKKADCQMRQK